uniref:Uncharacterized protein n=1 Tax=Asterionellopsis glacialis TaxID=33640 RepID=A0A7S0KX83_9STRA
MAIPGAAHLLQAIQAQQPSALGGHNFQLGQSSTLQSLQTQYGNSIYPLLGQIQLTNPDQQLAAQHFSPSSATPTAQAMGLLNQLTGNNSPYGTQQQTQYAMGTPQQSPFFAQQLLARQGVQHGNVQGNFGNVISSPSPFASTAVNNTSMQMQPSQQGGHSQDASAAFMDLEPRPIEDILNHGTRR